MSDDGVKTQLDRICHALTSRHGPLPSLDVKQEGHAIPWLHRATSPAVVEEAERRLGVALPPLLRAVLLRIANGGEAMLMVGIEPRLRHLSYSETRCYCDLVAAYFTEVRACEEEGREPWPIGRLPIFDRHGCGLVSCVDCTTPQGVVWMLNSGEWEIIAPTLVEYVEEPITPPSAV